MQIMLDAARRKIECPCKNCTDRQVGCHSKCEKHAEYQAERERAYKQVCETYEKERRLETSNIRGKIKTKTHKQSSKKWNDYRKRG
jgi:hypothetical protein